MPYPIHSIEQDIGGKWYARVCITDEQTVFLKFQDYPTEAEIQSAAAQFVMLQAEVPADGDSEQV